MDGQKHGGHGMRVTFRKSRTAGFLDVTIYRVRCDGEDIASIQANPPLAHQKGASEAAPGTADKGREGGNSLTGLRGDRRAMRDSEAPAMRP